MKPFDLEAAKRGEPIQTRDGRPVKFIAHVPEATESQQVVVLIGNTVRARYPTGTFLDFEGDDDDLFMAPLKRTVWVNVYYRRPCDWPGSLSTSAWDTKKDADEAASGNGNLIRIGNRAWPLEIEE